VLKKNRREEVLQDAWIGDAVLCLYARQKILREDASLDGEKYARMTSNHFLASIGEASEVEAAIGRAFERGGLDAAYLYIDQNLMPVFERQEQNRIKRRSGRHGKGTAPRPEVSARAASTLLCE
jgi:hypothetical protein